MGIDKSPPTDFLGYCFVGAASRLGTLVYSRLPRADLRRVLGENSRALFGLPGGSLNEEVGS